MSSGWLRDSVLAAPMPFGLKLWCSVVAKTICLNVNVLLGPLAPVLGLVEPELELGPELEHPAVASRLAATAAMPSRVAVCRLNIFIDAVLGDSNDALGSPAGHLSARLMARRWPKRKDSPHGDPWV